LYESRTPVELEPVIENSLQMFAGESKHLEIVYEFDSSLRSAHLSMDAARLQQVLINLISNSVKFTEKGCIELRIRLQTAKEEEKDKQDGEEGQLGPRMLLQFEVADTGIGIPATYISQLFSPFAQANASYARVYSGTGLGLSICKQLVTLAGGTISASSQEGEGAVFRFTWPVHKLDLVRTPLSPHVSMLHSLSSASEVIYFEKVLVIAPHQNLVSSICKHLRDCGQGAIGIGETRPCQDINECKSLYEEMIVKKSPLCIIMDSVSDQAVDVIDYVMEKTKNDPELSIRLVLMTHIAFPRVILKKFPVLQTVPPNLTVALLSKPVRFSRLIGSLRSTTVLTSSNIPVPHKKITSENKNNKGSSNDNSTITEPKQRTRILVVEDNITNQKVVLHMLRRLGYDADVAVNGAEAIHKFCCKPTEYGAILMDLAMPVVDGYEATSIIRRLPIPNAQSFPIIALTASVLEGDFERCMRQGMTDVLSKPATIQQLKEKLEARMVTPIPTIPTIPLPKLPTPVPTIPHTPSPTMPTPKPS